MHLPISHEVYRYSFRGYQAAIYLVWPTGHQEPPQRMILEITHPSRAAHTVHVESRYRSVELALLTGRCLFKHYVPWPTTTPTPSALSHCPPSAA